MQAEGGVLLCKYVQLRSRAGVRVFVVIVGMWELIQYVQLNYYNFRSDYSNVWFRR